MGSSDDEELAALRSARNARLGVSQPLAIGDDYGGPSPYFQDSGIPARATKESRESNEDGPAISDLLQDADLCSDGEVRGAYPMAFGDQEKASIDVQVLHNDARSQRKQATMQHGGDQLTAPTKASSLQSPRKADGGDSPVDAEALDHNADDDDDDSGDPYLMPITHETSLQGHAKMVTAIAVDTKGARVLTGSEDYELRMFDFGGMKRDMRSFRSITPSEGCAVNALSFSPTGDRFLVVTGSSQPKIYDRDGHELGEFVKGDMYIRDLTHTKGHQYHCYSGQWHPCSKDTAATCAHDGSVRLWDVDRLKQKTVLKPTLRQSGRVAVTTCCYNSDGSIIAAGLVDGSIQLWDVKGKVGRSAAIGQVAVPKAQMVPKQDWSYVAGATTNLQNAHEKGDDISSLCFSSDGNTLLSRSCDDSLKVWDVRKLKKPLVVFNDRLPAAPHSQCCFNPDESLIVTGTCEVPKSDDLGALVFFDKQRLELVKRVAMGASVAAINWHPTLNQIFVGTGNRKGGRTVVLYNPSYSNNGVLKAAARTPRAASTLDFEAPLIIKNPHALPMYRDESQQGGGGRKRKAELDAKKAKNKKQPDMGLSRPGQTGKGGTIGASSGALLTQHVLKQQGMMTVPEEEDVRALLLRHEGKADSEVSRLFSAYQKTQPERILADEEDPPQDAKK